MKNIDKLKDLALAVASAFICVLIYHTVGNVITGAIADDFLSSFLAETVFAALAIGTVILLKQTDLFHSDPALLKSGWTSAGILFAASMFLGLFGLSRLLNSGVTISAFQWILMIGHVLLVGFCEEVMFRGLIQRALHRLFGEDSFGHVFLAVLCNGIIFGCMHLFNMDRGNPMLATIHQVGITCFMGMLFGAIYYRTGKNIWYMMILHALYDLLGLIVNGRASGATLNNVLDTTGGSMSLLAVLIAIAVWGGVNTLGTLFILRPKKLNPLLEKAADTTPAVVHAEAA